jgi:tryptophan-rich sensory protein
MGISLGRLINLKAWSPVKLFAAQFVLNLIWTPVFFGAHQILIALAILFLLWILLAVTIKSAKKVDSISGWLLVPYLLWVSYATYLNAGIAWLNR